MKTTGIKMAVRVLVLFVLGYACAAPAANDLKTVEDQNINDLKTAASASYIDRYSDFSIRNYPSSGYSAYSVTGYGTLDDKNNYNAFGGAYGGYENPNAYNGFDRGYSGGSYAGNVGFDGYKGGHGGSADSDVYKGGYGGSPGYGGYGGNGGYGGYAGNGGLSSYYGYNNPNYQGAHHLGYGYYNKRPGYGNIYNSGITPSLVTGYRGYSRK